MGAPAERVSAILIQLNVPIEVITPAHRSILDPDGKRYNRHPLRFYRWPDQSHARFPRRPAALPVVARETGSHNVLPRGSAALHLRNHVIKSQLLCGIFDTAVLTDIPVALIDIGAGKSDLPAGTFHFDKLEQAKNGRKLERDGHTANVPVIEIDHLHLALSQQGDRPLPGNDLERFKCGVQKERPFHCISQRIPVSALCDIPDEQKLLKIHAFKLPKYRKL